MPDLPDGLSDDLRAMLHDRAGLAPASPAPSDRLVRRVRRRQAARATAIVAAPVLAVAAVVGVAAGIVGPSTRAVQPAGPGGGAWSFLDTDDRYEFCDPPISNPDIIVTVHETENKFAQGCVTARASAPMIQFSNGQQVAHDLEVRDPAGEVVIRFPAAANISYADRISVTAGDYELVCTLHETMRAQLVVR